MIDLTLMNSKYFSSDNWIQIAIPEERKGDLRKIYNILRNTFCSKKWYIFYKKSMCLIKMFIYQKDIDDFKKICQDINNICEVAEMHTFLPEYYQFGGKKSWDNCVKWFYECTCYYYDNNYENIYDYAYSVAMDGLFQLDKEIRTIILKNMCILRNISVTNIDCMDNFFRCKNSIINVKEYYKKTRTSVLCDYDKIWPFVYIFIFNILDLDQKSQVQLIEKLCINC